MMAHSTFIIGVSRTASARGYPPGQRSSTRARRAPILSALSLLLLLGAAACSALPGDVRTPSPATPDSIESLFQALEQAAVVAELDGPPSEPAVEVEGRILFVNEESVEAYQFADNTTRSEAQQALLESGELEPGVHVWGSGKLLVLYRGGEGGTILLISGLLGDPITAAAALEGPFPPAVTAAILAVAEREQVAPGQVQVVEFGEVTWQDTCLGLPQPQEDCEPTVLEGWRIELEVGGSEYTVRSDAVGYEVRIE